MVNKAFNKVEKNKKIKKFQKFIWEFYLKNRRNLVWRKNISPYKVLVSEIMLQQTQVSRVIKKFEQFIKQFPDFDSLAQASTADILKYWSGLGYNRRALYLKQVAETINSEHGGILPKTVEEMARMPGIGPATAASVLVFAFNKPLVFIETNIRAVFIDYFFKKNKSKEVNDKDILPLVKKSLDKKKARLWYYALMDYGSYLKKTNVNPNRKSAHYVKQSQFKGSNRQLRGLIIKILNNASGISNTKAYVCNYYQLEREAKEHGFDKKSVSRVLKALELEGFIRQKGNLISL